MDPWQPEDVTSIEVLGSWLTFGDCPTNGWVIFTNTKTSDWSRLVYEEGLRDSVSDEAIHRFIIAANELHEEPRYHLFGESKEVVDHHFDRHPTGDRRELIVRILVEGGKKREFCSFSNRGHMLPFREGEIENFNPEVSLTLADILPDGWLFKECLQEISFEQDRESLKEIATLRAEAEACKAQANESEAGPESDKNKGKNTPPPTPVDDFNWIFRKRELAIHERDESGYSAAHGCRHATARRRKVFAAHRARGGRKRPL